MDDRQKKILGLMATAFSGDDNVQIGVLNALDDQFDEATFQYQQGIDSVINNIPEAKKLAIESKKKEEARKQKAKDLGNLYKLQFPGLDKSYPDFYIDSAKSYLKKYDPDNTLNLKNLEKDFLSRQIVQQEEIKNNVKTSPSSFSTEKRDSFMEQFNKPKMQDLFEGAAETGQYQEIDPNTGKLVNISASQIKDYFETAQNYDPNQPFSLTPQYNYAFPIQRGQAIQRNLSEGINRGINLVEKQLKNSFGITIGEGGKRIYETDDFKDLYRVVYADSSNYLATYAPVVPEELDSSQPLVSGNVPFAIEASLAVNIGNIYSSLAPSQREDFKKNNRILVASDTGEKIINAANQRLDFKPIVQAYKNLDFNGVAQTITNPLTGRKFKNIGELGKYDLQTGSNFAEQIIDNMEKYASDKAAEEKSEIPNTPDKGGYDTTSAMVDGKITTIYRSKTTGQLFLDPELTKPYR